MRKFLLFIFFLFLGGFLFLPKISIAKEITIEDLIGDSERIQLEEDEGKRILASLIQELQDEWGDVVVEGGDKVLEKEVALLIMRKAVQKDLFNYLFLEAPKDIGKEIVKIGAKIVAVVWGGDPSTISKKAIEEIEKLTVEKAKEYIIKWLLQNRIKVTGGNLSISYFSLRAELQHIIIYKPLDADKGRVSINIYSSSVINNILSPRRGFQWEGGIEELPPFILEINGVIEKDEYGAYNWVEGPEMNFVFDQKVPEFSFKEPGFFDKLKSKINKNLLAFDKLKRIIDRVGQKGKEYGVDFWKRLESILSDINPFKATVNPFSEDDFQIDVSDTNTGESDKREDLPEESSSEEDFSQEGEKQEENRSEDKNQPKEENLSEEEEINKKQEQIDDILERIDILRGKIDKFSRRRI